MHTLYKAQAILGICLLCSLLSPAQRKFLQVGDTMPDIALTGMINYPDAQPRVHDFKGKLLIIDFWDRGCTGCIESFPKTEALQEQFKGQVQIIMATRNTPGQIDTLFTQPWIVKRKARRTRLPCVLGDTAISGLFPPFFYVPHHIWIDGNGKILYITGGYNATPGHIRAVLNGQHPYMATKIDVNRDIMEQQSLLAFAGTEAPAHVKYSSFFMDYSEQLPNVYSRWQQVDSVNQVARVDYTNFPILQLFREAFTEDIVAHFNDNYFNDNRLLWKVDDSAGFFRPHNSDSLDNWNVRNCYSYEQVVPLAAMPSRYRLMQEDLNRYFSGLLGIEARVVRVRKKCLVLVNGPAELLQSKGERDPNILYSKPGETPEWRAYINMPFKEVRDGIYYSYISLLRDGPLPFIDETSFRGNTDLRFDHTARSVPELNKQLSRYGLKIITADRWINMLQIEKSKRYAQR